jgi:PEP-CTERM motif
MRRMLLGLVAGTALALGSAASAAVVVTGSAGLNKPDPFAAGSVVTAGATTTINFGQNPVSNPFSGSFGLTNTESGLYSILLGSSSPGVAFTSATLTGGGNIYTLLPFPDSSALRLAPTEIGAGNYLFSFSGSAPAGGTMTGNVTIIALPEPASWAMMILGFGGIGLIIRRRRRPALAQIA